MNIALEETIKRLPKSPTELTKGNINRIKEEMPIPREQKVLWADVTIGRRISGIVLTDVGIFLKAGKKVIDKRNEGIKEKKKKLTTMQIAIIYFANSFCSFQIKVCYIICRTMKERGVSMSY